MRSDASNSSGRVAQRIWPLVLAAIATVVVAGCTPGSAPTLAGSSFPRSLHFAPLAADQGSPNCDPVQISASSVGPAGGPAPTYVVASEDGLQLFADCTRIGVSANDGDSWIVRRVAVDVFAATISASGTILALGFLPANNSISQLESSDGGRSWTRNQLTGSIPSSSDSLTCSPSGLECLAFPSLMDSWSDYCPTPMGAPLQPPRPYLPSFLYRRGQGWDELPALPSGFLVNGAAISAAGTIWMTGQVGSRGELLSSSDGGAQFNLAITTSVPLSGVSFDGDQGMVVGGSAVCLQGKQQSEAEVAYSSSDSGASWAAELDTHTGSQSLTAVQIVASGVAYATGTYHDVTDGTCGEVTFSNCFSRLLVTKDEGRTWVSAWGGSQLPFYGLQDFASGSAKELVAVANAGLVTSSDGGANWTFRPELGAPEVTSAQFFPADPSDGMALAEIGPTDVTLRTSDGGQSWTLSPAPVPTGLDSTAWVSLKVGYEVADRGQLLRTTNAGRSWQQLSWPYSRDQPRLVNFQSRDVGWAEVQIGARDVLLVMTTDGGHSWRKVGTGLDPEWAAALSRGGTEEQLRLSTHGWVLTAGGPKVEAHHKLAHWKDPLAGALQPGGWIWVTGSLEGYTPTGCGACGPVIWLGNRRGAMWQYRSPDGTAGITSIGFASHQRGWLIANSTIYTTKDGGRNWSPIELTFSGPGLSSGT